jgi:7-cyano-7-deazaguanine synthase in queuosine biosynthesis
VHPVSHMTSPFAARVLTLTLGTSPRGIDLRYAVDDRPDAAIQIRYPEGVALPAATIDLIAAAGAIYLGSLALVEEIRIEAPVSPGLLRDVSPIVEMLYDIRRWKDELPLGPLPTITASERERVEPLNARLNRQATAALWSGGKDSTLALITLRANGYIAHPVHMTANSGVEDIAQQAVARLAADLSESPVTILIEHDDFIDFTNTYATEWDRFPLCNRIPFGRDLLLAAVAVPFAIHRGAACVSMGHDNECRTAVVDYHGKVIPRNDLESAAGAIVLEAAMRRHVHPDLTLLPPVANLSELRILHDMFGSHEELMAKSAFCFWGENCGRCAKCLRYYLADRVYGSGNLSFQENPLGEGMCPELDEILAPNPRSTLFQQEVLLLLGRLVEQDDVRAEETEIERFRRVQFARVQPLLDSWEAELLAERRDPQVPTEFRPAVAVGPVRSSA